jgi:3-oxoacyl-(acyl-carrier-protein) synthase
MSRRPLPARCRVSGDVVRVRTGRGGWHALRAPGAGRRAACATAADVARVSGLGDRLVRLDATSRAAVIAAHVALSAATAALRVAPPADRVFLWVTMPDGSAAADRDYWVTACDSGGAHASPQRFVATLPSAVAGDLTIALGLRGPAIVTAGAEAPPDGVPPAALDVATGVADLLVCVSVGAAAENRRPRVFAVAVPLLAHVSGRGRRDSLRSVPDLPRRSRGGRPLGR